MRRPSGTIVFREKAWADTDFITTYAHLMAANPTSDPSKVRFWGMEKLGAHLASRFKPALKNKCSRKAHQYLAEYSGELHVVDTGLRPLLKTNIGRYLDD